jgi:hypothetical protein
VTLRGPVLAITYVPVAEALSEAAAAFVAFTETLYEPPDVPAGDVTVKVAVPLLPGDNCSLEPLHTPVHPDGTRSPRLKVAVEQAELSLLTTVATKLTGVPGVTL